MSGHSTEERFIVAMEARRRWSRSEKLAIVGEIGTDAVSAVARRHNIAPSLLFRWKREFGQGSMASPAAREQPLVRVALGPAATDCKSKFSSDDDDARDRAIEIVLAGGHRVIVGKHVDPVALKRVLSILQER